MKFLRVESFEQWREVARRLMSMNVPPADVHWSDVGDELNLFDEQIEECPPGPSSQISTATVTVPQSFLDTAQLVACHRSSDRWMLLYRILWRLNHGERSLMEIATDDDVYTVSQMKKSITRDAHKMKAFVRFRKVVSSDPSGNQRINYIAWHRPDHKIVRLVAPFFSRRFKEMDWTILTPDESASWDQQTLVFGPGVPATEAPQGDELEELWKTYYASIFNPARIKTKAMIREMPKRHWATLPEAAIIDQLLSEAPARVEKMIEQQEGFSQTAANFMPDDRSDLIALRQAVVHCRACDLCHRATQAVFGIGPSDSRIVLVGEQPGDQEDLVGLPFVGPAGQLLTEAMNRAGFGREQVYITNVVKHFKFTEGSTSRGTKRLHQKPSSREIFACRPWLEAELGLIQPRVIVCLGTTAAQALIGRDFQVTVERGRSLATNWCPNTIATWHPAAILRQPDTSRQQQMQEQLVRDLTLAWRISGENSLDL